MSDERQGLDDFETRPATRSRVLIAAAGAVALVTALLLLWLDQGNGSTPEPERPDSTRSTTEAGRSANGRTGLVGRSADAADPRRFDANPDESPSRLPERGVIGSVRTTDDRPIPGAEVRLFRRDPEVQIRRSTQGSAWPPDATERTDAGGTFSFRIGRSGSNRFQILVRHPDYASSRGFADLGPNEGLVDVGTFVLDPGLRLQGRVVLAASGLPVRGAIVTARRTTLRPGDPPAPEPLRRAITGFDGAFDLAPLPKTAIEIEVRTPEYPGLSRRLDLARDPPLEPLRLALESPNSLAGHVFDELGLPIDAAEVQASPIDPEPDDHSTPVTTSCFTDADGRFRFVNLPRGAVRIRILADGHESLSPRDPIAVGRNDLEFRLQTHARIPVIVRTGAGRLVRTYDLRPLQVVGSNPDWLAVAPDTSTTSVRADDLRFGQALIGPLPPGETVLEVRADGFATSYSAVFEPSTWPPGREIEIRLEDGATLTGRVLDHRGRGLAAANVQLRPDPTRTGSDPAVAWAAELVAPRGSSAEATTDDRGRFSIDRLSAGRYRLVVEHADHAATEVDRIRLDRDSRLDLGTLALSRGTQITGIVRFDGQTAGRAEVRILAPGRSERSQVQVLAETRTDAEGRFALPRRLSSGDYLVSVARESDSALQVLLDHRWSERPLTVRGDEPVLEVPLEITTRR